MKIYLSMSDPRLRTILSEARNEADIVIIGFASDEGCVANGGRAGAAQGPEEVFKLLPKVGPVVNVELDVDISSMRVYLEDTSSRLTHQALQQRVSEIAGAKQLCIVVGGSNDQSLPNSLGLLKHHPNLDVVNIDAHLDVRPGVGHSGSPFQELLNHPSFQGQFYEYATQGNQASKEHIEWALSKGTKITWLNQVKDDSFPALLQDKDTPLFVSFDIDAIRAADCPGVSCPGTRGLSADQALDMCFQAGACERVVGLDLSEFNPAIENNITPRLVCQMIYYFVMGASKRSKTDK